MNKKELIEAIAAKAECSKACAHTALDAVLDSIKAGTKKHGKVQLIGFGTFHAKKRPARTCRNPKTGAPMKTKAKTVFAFKGSSAVKV